MSKVAFPELQMLQASYRSSTSLKTVHGTFYGISKADASQE